MSADSCDCERCGRHCKDRRGLSVHMRACQGNKALVCEYCNTTFGSVYSLTVHSTRCVENKKQKEEQDKLVKNELQELQEKLKNIEVVHQNKLKEMEIKSQQDIKDLNLKVRADYEQQLKLRDNDLKSYYKDVEELKIKLTKEEEQNKFLKAAIDSNNVTLQTVMDINAKLSMKDTNTTIINNDNRVQLQSLDPSMIQGRIQPPEYAIGNVNDLVCMLRSLGVRNCFRVNDKSRGTLSWNKPGEGEIRDPKGDQLLTHIIDSLSDDLTKEKCYFEEELKKLYNAEEQDLYQINESRIFVNFCTQLLRKDPDILKKIKKELVKQGRAKGDPEQDEIREVSYNKFITSILTTLFPKILVWIEMSFFELGQYIGRKIKDRYHLEGASREDLYIVVHTDGGGHKQVFSKKLMVYIKEAYEMAIDNELTERMLTELLVFKAVDVKRVETMLKYIKNPTLDETLEVMRGMVSL